MKFRYWILWLLCGVLLLGELPYPWYFAGMAMWVYAIYRFVLAVQRAISTNSKLEDALYTLFELNEKVCSDWLVNAHGIPKDAVQSVLRKWASKGWIRQCEPPPGAHETNDLDWYNITRPGQVQLGEKFGNG